MKFAWYPSDAFLPGGALLLGAGLAVMVATARADYPVERPPLQAGAAPAAEGNYTVFPDHLKQVVKGLGYEIQSDSIASGNSGLPAATTSALHDLVPAERARLYREMLHGFRYCRLAGGLYWRGLDAEGKHMQGRWPEQLPEIKEMLQKAGVEGVSLEYWSPAPFWKANRQYASGKGENILRCFGKNFADDADYHGDVDRFLADFAAACGQDLATLRAAGIPVSMWGLQNEPFANTAYSSCVYTPANYARTFLAVAPSVRAFDPKISIIADTAKGSYIAPVLRNPETASLVDAMVIHHVGSDAAGIRVPRPSDVKKPHFQNEYEYLNGPTSPSRCLNTAMHVLNWLQLGEAPTWFWIHALKPMGNKEASGYSLGFFRPANQTNPADDVKYGGLQPGHWKWNPYNWNAVGSFLRHMPWDCQVVDIKSDETNPNLSVLAFKKPNGKLTIVLANRCFAAHTFHLNTGLTGATFRGFRYVPDDAGADCQGQPIAALSGPTVSPRVEDMTWEFWEQQ